MTVANATAYCRSLGFSKLKYSGFVIHPMHSNCYYIFDTVIDREAAERYEEQSNIRIADPEEYFKKCDAFAKKIMRGETQYRFIPYDRSKR
jgi:hypothetical protein